MYDCIDYYLSSINTKIMRINSDLKSSLRLGCFGITLHANGSEIPLCLSRNTASLPIILPSLKRKKRNLSTALKTLYKTPLFCAGLIINGIETKGGTFYIAKNLILDSDGVPLFLPVVDTDKNESKFYFHYRIAKRDSFISRALYYQVLPRLKDDVFWTCDVGVDGARYEKEHNGAGQVKPTTILSDMSDFISTPDSHFKPSTILDFDFAALVSDNLQKE